MSPDLYYAALANDNLVEVSTVLEFDGDYLVSDTCLSSLLQQSQTLFRNGM